MKNNICQHVSESIMSIPQGTCLSISFPTFHDVLICVLNLYLALVSMQKRPHTMMFLELENTGNTRKYRSNWLPLKFVFNMVKNLFSMDGK